MMCRQEHLLQVTLTMITEHQVCPQKSQKSPIFPQKSLRYTHLFIHIHKDLFMSLWQWSLGTMCARKRSQRAIYSAKEPICPQHYLFRKRAPYVHKRAPYVHKRALSFIHTYPQGGCWSHSDDDHWAPGVPAKESKEPYISAKEPHISAKELYISESIRINLCIYIYISIYGFTYIYLSIYAYMYSFIHIHKKLF